MDAGKCRYFQETNSNFHCEEFYFYLELLVGYAARFVEIYMISALQLLSSRREFYNKSPQNQLEVRLNIRLRQSLK